MSVGDWSNDGHGLHEDYVVKSAKPVEEVREAHFKIKSATGVDIEDICCECQDCGIMNDDYEKLEALGYGFDDREKEMHTLTAEGMAHIWLFLLNLTDPSLKLQFAPKEEMPTLHFYGYDEKNRHINFVGYGCFQD